jgi:hypothetical protein
MKERLQASFDVRTHQCQDAGTEHWGPIPRISTCGPIHLQQSKERHRQAIGVHFNDQWDASLLFRKKEKVSLDLNSEAASS